MAFPKGFVWGVATSSYQIEGATSKDGRGVSIWDTFCAAEGAIQDGTSGAVACDHYHRWAEDIRLMKNLGLKAYRFSVAWPRILPTGSESAPHPAGLDFYDRLVDGLLDAGIAPWVTLYHWDLPQPLEDAGGWPQRGIVDRFVHFADVVSRRLGDRVKNWITINEPWVISIQGYQLGIHAPGRQSWPDALCASHHLLLAHGRAVAVIRANAPEARVGITLNLCPAEPASPSAADAAEARAFDGYFNRWFLDPLFGRGYPKDKVADYIAEGHLPPSGLGMVQEGDLQTIACPTDFLGVNYYSRAVVRSTSVPEHENHGRTVYAAPPSEYTDMGWEVHAPSLRRLLERLHQDYRPPGLVITENGASYATAPTPDGRVRDRRRIQYLRDHLAACEQALASGVPLEGYFAWSLFDNFEWERGYSQRFGLVWVDYATQARIPKDSAHWYATTIATGALAPLPTNA